MRQPFCILVLDGDLLDGGELTLVGTAESLDDAKVRIAELADICPGDYIIYDCDTGDRVYVTASVLKSGNQNVC